MPKMKTNKSAKGAFRFTGNGKLMRTVSPKGHKRRNKSKRTKRMLDRWLPVAQSDEKRIRRILPYGLD